MPRNLAGKFIVINTFVPGTTITALSHNENWADAANEISNSLAADGQTPMSGPLKAVAGAATAPALTFSADPDTGMYRAGTNILAFAAGGAAKLTLSETAAVLTVPLQAPDLPFPAGTRMLFNQSTAPANWVKDTSLSDRVLRLVNGSVTNGGVIGLSTFVARTQTDARSLVAGNLPAHTHSGTTNNTNTDHTHFYSGQTGGASTRHTHSEVVTNPNRQVQSGSGETVAGTQAGGTTGNDSPDHAHSFEGNTGQVSTNSSHLHGFTTDGGSGLAGTAFTMPIDCRLAYTDVIIAQRS